MDAVYSSKGLDLEGGAGMVFLVMGWKRKLKNVFFPGLKTKKI